MFSYSRPLFPEIHRRERDHAWLFGRRATAGVRRARSREARRARPSRACPQARDHRARTRRRGHPAHRRRESETQCCCDISLRPRAQGGPETAVRRGLRGRSEPRQGPQRSERNRNTFGSRLDADNYSTRTEPLLAAYEQAGIIFVGKSNAPEFGFLPTTEPPPPGPCHNPWSLDHSTGGSSGGAAAAVAAGMVPFRSRQ